MWINSRYNNVILRVFVLIFHPLIRRFHPIKGQMCPEDSLEVFGGSLEQKPEGRNSIQNHSGKQGKTTTTGRKVFVE